MSRHTQICVPIVSASPALGEQVDAARRAGADLVELRVDLIGDVAAVEALLDAPPGLPVILTVRAASDGGAWTGADNERIALIERLGLKLPGYVDVELATWRRSANLRQKILLVGQRMSDPGAAPGQTGAPVERERNTLILSAHDFASTPDDLTAVFDALLATPAAILKLACKADDATDALRMLLELRRCAPQRPTIALAMGEAGLAARVLAKKHGAFLTFAALERGSESAPGQPTISELRDLYRWHALGAATRVYGVVGWPVGHSLSPLVHNAAMEHDGVDGVYVPLPVQPTAAAFARFMASVVANPALDIAGLSVTIPHKEHALRWLKGSGGRVSSLARRIGAVNTLAREPDGTWSGDNTDALGALAAIRVAPRFRGAGLHGARTAVLGAGGAARAVVVGLLDAGARVTIVNRTAERAAALATELGCEATTWDGWDSAGVELLVNCTPIGMWPEVDASPLGTRGLGRDTVVFDTIYRPARTRLLVEAERSGCTTISGVEMFVAQAAAQYQQWHGRPAPLDVMRTSLLRALPTAPAG